MAANVIPVPPQPPQLARYAELYQPGHPLASKSGRVQIHRDTLYSAIGPGEHPCHWCGAMLHWTTKPREAGSLLVDHLDRDIFNGALSNLVPSCNHCNIDRQRRSPCPSKEVACPQCGVVFLTKTDIHGIPYRRYCSRSCVSAHQSVIRRRPKIEVECEQCGREYKTRPPHPTEKKPRFCSTACATKSQWESGSLKPTERKLEGKSYWAFTGDHPLTAQSKLGRTGEHRVVLYAKIGPGPHPCHWCGKLVDWRLTPIRKGTTTTNDLVADHVDSNRHNNAPENLVPSCNHCNAGRSRVKPKGHYICEECGVGFDRAPSKNPKWNKFCSGSCRTKALIREGTIRFPIPNPRTVRSGELYVQSGAHKRRAKECTCAQCSKVFLAPAGKDRKFCSHKCYSLNLKGSKRQWRPQT